MNKQAYWQGFVEECHTHGVAPGMLVKFAQGQGVADHSFPVPQSLSTGGSGASSPTTMSNASPVSAGPMGQGPSGSPSSTPPDQTRITQSVGRILGPLDTPDPNQTDQMGPPPGFQGPFGDPQQGASALDSTGRLLLTSKLRALQVKRALGQTGQMKQSSLERYLEKKLQ